MTPDKAGEATARPWHDCTTKAEAQDDVRTITADELTNGKYIIARFYGPDRRANTAMALRAVNFHDELAAMLRECADHFEGVETIIGARATSLELELAEEQCQASAGKIRALLARLEKGAT